MDPSNPTRSSPPQNVLSIIDSTVKRYRNLTARIKSKQLALQRLEQGPPRSVKTKISLTVSKELENTDSAASLRAQFNQQLVENEKSLAEIIKTATTAELNLLQTELETLSVNAIKEISSFYCDVHTLFMPSGPPWESAITSPNGQNSMAVTDFLMAKALLNTRLTQLRYDLAIEQVIKERAKAAKEAKRATAMDIESETPMATSVQELVNKRIQQELRPLKNQVSRLKEALNDSAGRQRGTDRRITKTAKPQQQKKSAKPQKEGLRANGKAGATGLAKSGKPPTKSNSGKNNKQKGARNAKGKTRSK